MAARQKMAAGRFNLHGSESLWGFTMSESMGYTTEPLVVIPAEKSKFSEWPQTGTNDCPYHLTYKDKIFKPYGITQDS
jgi:hypothetical protein